MNLPQGPDDDDYLSRLSLRSLAEMVKSELVAAGLPVTPGQLVEFTAGAEVLIEESDNRVTVDWNTHTILTDATQDAWGDDPFWEGPEAAAFNRLNNAIFETMQDSMYTILTAAGFEVAKETDPDFTPHRLLVTRRLAMSPWQTRRDAHFDSRRERKVAAWNQRHEDERRATGKDSSSE
ncbi:hypothetical protein [Amycolatopsis sp. NPDC051372]|uniref:hypothetical protein n=1 Tax=unclassified Amycolatopsis TaxID=2618356 RepID=UPI003446F1C6